MNLIQSNHHIYIYSNHAFCSFYLHTSKTARDKIVVVLGFAFLCVVNIVVEWRLSDALKTSPINASIKYVTKNMLLLSTRSFISIIFYWFVNKYVHICHTLIVWIYFANMKSTVFFLLDAIILYLQSFSIII